MTLQFTIPAAGEPEFDPNTAPEYEFKGNLGPGAFHFGPEETAKVAVEWYKEDKNDPRIEALCSYMRQIEDGQSLLPAIYKHELRETDPKLLDFFMIKVWGKVKKIFRLTHNTP